MKRFIILFCLLLSFGFVLANDEIPFEDLAPPTLGDEISAQDLEVELVAPVVEKDTDDKGIYYEIYYDEYERAVEVRDYFIWSYVGISEYEYYENLIYQEIDGHEGYTWSVKRENGVFMKGDKVIATRVREYSKDGELLSEERTGSSLLLRVAQALSLFYNVEPPEDF